MEDFSQYNGEGTTLRKVQLRLVDMLVEIDKICRKHGIKYWITAGSLLGAVRHGGFIPWDDDLDIGMLSEDLHKFIEIAPKELPENLLLQTAKTDPSFKREIVRVRLKNSLFITPHDDFTRDYNKGLFIDLFETVPYPNVNPTFQRFIFKWYQKAVGFYIFPQPVTIKNHIAAITFPIIKLGFNVIWSLLNLGPKNKLGSKKQLNTSGASGSKELFFPIKEINFEGHVFMGPANPDRLLSLYYGDYLAIPPEGKRVSHMVHVEFFDQ